MFMPVFNLGTIRGGDRQKACDGTWRAGARGVSAWQQDSSCVSLYEMEESVSEKVACLASTLPRTCVGLQPGELVGRRRQAPPGRA
jgi:hypothetical protein